MRFVSISTDELIKKSQMTSVEIQMIRLLTWCIPELTTQIGDCTFDLGAAST